MDHLAAGRKAAGAVRHDSLALRRADRGAQVRLARSAGLALAAFRRVQRDHVVALPDRLDAGAHVDDDARALVPEDRGEQAFRVRARARELIRVTDAAGADFDQDLTGLRAVEVDFEDLERLAGRPCYRCARLHPLPPPVRTYSCRRSARSPLRLRRRRRPTRARRPWTR